MATDTTKIKLAAIGALGIAIGLFAAVVLSALQQVPADYSTAVLSSPPQANHVATTSFTTSPTTSSSSAQTSNTTSNWAGYVSTGGTYTSVSGSWKVPTVAAGSEPMAADATWIGIGGDASNDLIQVGTQNMVQDSQVTTGTFYERLPDTSVDVPTVSVNAGDDITASVKETSPGEWTISISDTSTGETFTNTVAYSSSESSAEWIEEAPSASSGIIPLDGFGSITFTNGSTTENGTLTSIAESNAQAVTMDNGAGEALTSTSAVDASGSGFTVTRTSASSESAYGQYYVTTGRGWGRQEPGRGAWGRSGFRYY